MELSARNKIKGKIKDIKLGDVMAKNINRNFRWDHYELSYHC